MIFQSCNQHLPNKCIKQTINSRRIVLIRYWLVFSLGLKPPTSVAKLKWQFLLLYCRKNFGRQNWIFSPFSVTVQGFHYWGNGEGVRGGGGGWAPPPTNRKSAHSPHLEKCPSPLPNLYSLEPKVNSPPLNNNFQLKLFYL